MNYNDYIRLRDFAYLMTGMALASVKNEELEKLVCRNKEFLDALCAEIEAKGFENK